jgi:O-antigen/teichoic acid export membrane protein
MLGVIKGDTDVGLYSTAVKVYTLVNSTVASVLVVVLPQLSYQFRQKNYDEINKLISYSVRFVMTAGIPCIVGIIAVADQLVAVVAGPDYISASEPLRILTVALLFSYMGGIVGNIILVPSGNEKVCLFSTGISAMINVITNVVLIPLLGINGAAITTGLSEMVAFFFGLHFVDKRIRIGSLREVLISPLVGSLPIFLYGYVFNTFVKNVYVSLFGTIIASVVTYIIIQIILRNTLITGIFDSVIIRLRKKD